MAKVLLTWSHHHRGRTMRSISFRLHLMTAMHSLAVLLLCCGVALAQPKPQPDQSPTPALASDNSLASSWSTLVMVLNVVLLPSSLVALTLGHIAGLQLPFPRLAWYRTPYSDIATICGRQVSALSIRALQAWMMVCWALLLVMYAATEKSVPKFFSFAFTPFCVGHGCMMLWVSTRLKQLHVLRMRHQPPPPEIPDIPMHEAQLVVVLQPDFDEDGAKSEMTDPGWYWNGIKGVSLAITTNPNRIDRPPPTATQPAPAPNPPPTQAMTSSPLIPPPGVPSSTAQLRDPLMHATGMAPNATDGAVPAPASAQVPRPATTSLSPPAATVPRPPLVYYLPSLSISAQQHGRSVSAPAQIQLSAVDMALTAFVASPAPATAPATAAATAAATSAATAAGTGPGQVGSVNATQGLASPPSQHDMAITVQPCSEVAAGGSKA